MKKQDEVRRSSESGQAVLLLVATSALVLLGFAGLAADAGLLFQQKRLVQTAADSAAIAGATQLNSQCTGALSAVTAAALADAALNGFTNGQNGATVTVNVTGSNPCYVEVIVSENAPTYFMRAVGRKWNSMTVNARAVATLTSGHVCIFALGSLTPGNANLAGGCLPAYDNSKAPGTMAAVSNPLAYLTPPSCASNGSYDPATGQYSPGLFSSGIPPITGSSNVTFAAGTYCVGGSGLYIRNTPTINGTGVTFYLSGSAAIDIKIDSGGTLNVSAPTSGPYTGILFYQDPSDTASASFVDAGTGSIAGVFYIPGPPYTPGAPYMPGPSLTFQGNSGATFYTPLIAQSITLGNGGGTFDLLPYPPPSPNPPLSPITAATLVE